MITRIREVRRARGMTLDDVAQGLQAATTPQTIGSSETGTRTVSIGWLNRIAEALGVDAADLVEGRRRESELPVVAVLGTGGARAEADLGRRPPRPKAGQVAITVSASNGDYRAGDEIWCDTVESDGFAAAVNRDVLVPRPAGRFLSAGSSIATATGSNSFRRAQGAVSRSCPTRHGLPWRGRWSGTCEPAFIRGGVLRNPALALLAVLLPGALTPSSA